MQRDELAGWLRLALAPGIGPATARSLLAAFGLPEDIFSRSPAALQQLLTRSQAQALLATHEAHEALLEPTWAWLNAGDGPPRRIVTLADSDYPAALLQTEDPPLLLYLLGRCATAPVVWPTALAMVGSRNPTPQGRTNARQFAASFAGAGITVVSGLALGIDGAAHEGALEGAQGLACATIAVVGTGLDRVYPGAHKALAHRIAEHGLLVSEYHLGTPPLAHNFPRRNRVISGLSLGTLVVEAALQSGSLITARLAAEQGKEVFAIPGSIHAAQSRGCHQLLKQGAKLVETAQDVLEELRLPNASFSIAAQADSKRLDSGFDADETGDPVLAAAGHDPIGLDELVARTGLPTAQLQAALLELELRGLIARLPGGRFQRQATG